jgi:hypothetical protein
VEASYYYNSITGEATWIKPEDFDGDVDYFLATQVAKSSNQREELMAWCFAAIEAQLCVRHQVFGMRS